MPELNSFHLLLAAIGGGAITAVVIAAFLKTSKEEKPSSLPLSSSSQTTTTITAESSSSLSSSSSSTSFWLDGAVIGTGPAGGKSTLTTASNTKSLTVVVDAENYVAWNRLKHLSLIDRNSNFNGGNFETETDMTALFFRGVVPATLASLMLGQVVLYNCIDAKSSLLAGMFHSGIQQLFPSSTSPPSSDENEEFPRASILFVDDQADLDTRIASRKNQFRFGNNHGSYTWHVSCHTLWRGLASHFKIPSFASNNNPSIINENNHLEFLRKIKTNLLQRHCPKAIPSRLEQIVTRRHSCHFSCELVDYNSQANRRCYFTLVEVLPLQWALYQGKISSCFDYSSSTTTATTNDDNEVDATPEFISWFHFRFPSARQEQTNAMKLPKEANKLFTTQEDRSYVEQNATLLVQSPFIAPNWGRADTPFHSIAILSKEKQIILFTPGSTHPGRKTTTRFPSCTATMVPMISTRRRNSRSDGKTFDLPCGYNSPFVETFHLQTSTNMSENDDLDKGLNYLAHNHENLPPLPTKQSLPSLTMTTNNNKNNTDTNTTSNNSKKKCVILYYGSFAPFHAGHKETLVLAKKELEVNQNYQVLGAYVVPVAHLYPKDYPLEGLRPWALRAAICQFCVSDLGWCAVDFAQGSPNVCVESLAQRISALFKNDELENEQDVSVVWINGTDITVSKYMKHLIQSTSCVDLLFMPRGSEETKLNEAASRQAEIDSIFNDDKHRRRALVGSMLPTLSLSSTKVRKAIAEASYEEARRMIGNDAASAYCFWSTYEKDFFFHPDPQETRTLPFE